MTSSVRREVRGLFVPNDAPGRPPMGFGCHILTPRRHFLRSRDRSKGQRTGQSEAFPVCRTDSHSLSPSRSVFRILDGRSEGTRTAFEVHSIAAAAHIPCKNPLRRARICRTVGRSTEAAFPEPVGPRPASEGGDLSIAPQIPSLHLRFLMNCRHSYEQS